MLNVDPKKLAAIQEATRNIKGEITVDYREKSVFLKFTANDEKALEALPGLLESFSVGLGQQLEMFFAISGRIIEKNKGA